MPISWALNNEIDSLGGHDKVRFVEEESLLGLDRYGVVKVIVGGICCGLFVMAVHQPPSASGVAAGDEDFVELAPYMTRLQTLTHKLALSLEHDNRELAEFYLYESLEALEDIKTDVPEYRGQPVALLVDRLATPTYKALQAALAKDKQASLEGVSVRSKEAFSSLIKSCNQCHVVTQHAFIEIPEKSGNNPFLQSFTPRPKPE